VILVLTATTMLFAAGASMRQMLILLGVGLVASYAMIRVASYRNARLMLWLEGPFSDPSGEGMQLVQALYALDRGGWLGVGLGHSQQKFTVYAPHTDGIFAILCEEMGVIGALAVVGLYGLWTWRGLRIAWYARDVYGRVLAVGLTAWVVFQAAVHVGVLTATIPFTGTVLPFISYGGSSLSSSILSAGLLLSISRDAGAPEEEHAS
ncbi:MAG: FtsW/RodA/SpoVE family cell cycle protein, partial [Chloroflexi bacterium]|nr:FtsW/RodA/SpoVE family cell cycle protein [Chloroflexota bacterium]